MKTVKKEPEDRQQASKSPYNGWVYFKGLNILFIVKPLYTKQCKKYRLFFFFLFKVSEKTAREAETAEVLVDQGQEPDHGPDHTPQEDSE